MFSAFHLFTYTCEYCVLYIRYICIILLNIHTHSHTLLCIVWRPFALNCFPWRVKRWVKRKTCTLFTFVACASKYLHYGCIIIFIIFLLFCLKTKEIYFFTALEDRCLQSRCGQALASSEMYRGESPLQNREMISLKFGSQLKVIKVYFRCNLFLRLLYRNLKGPYNLEWS